MDKQQRKKLQILEEGPKVMTRLDSLKATLRNSKLENSRPWWHTRILVLKNSQPYMTDYQPK